MPNPLAQFYRVKQYGQENCEVVEGLTKGELTDPEKCPWLKNFTGDFEDQRRFSRFEIEEFSPTQCAVVAYYSDGTHWVASTARVVAQSRA